MFYRNEVWRHNPKEFSTHGRRALGFFFKGFPLGFAAFVATIGFEYAFISKDNHSHGHGDEAGAHGGHH